MITLDGNSFPDCHFYAASALKNTHKEKRFYPGKILKIIYSIFNRSFPPNIQSWKVPQADGLTHCQNKFSKDSCHLFKRYKNIYGIKFHT